MHHAEIFPWAIAYAAPRLRSLNKRFTLLFFLLILSACYATIEHNSDYLEESVRSILAYLNPVLLFLVLLRISESQIYRFKKILSFVMFMMFSIGILQSTGILAGLDFFFKSLVPRGGSTDFGWGRGVLLLSSEPSRAAFEITFIYAAWRAMIKADALKLFAADLLFAIFLVFIIKSATGLLLVTFYLIAIYRLKALILLVVLLLLALSFDENSNIRALSVAVALTSALSIRETLEVLLNTSGFRGVSVLSAFYYGVVSIFGGGVGAWPVSSVHAMQAAGFNPTEIDYFIYDAASDFAGVRPTSYLANIALDCGVFGLICFAYFFVPFFKKALRCNVSIRPLLWLFLFCLIFNGDVGNPIPWLVLALCIRCLQKKGFDYI